MEGVSVSGYSILNYIFIFVLYVITHYLIGKQLEKTKVELINNENKELIKKHKKLNILFKWYPFLYLCLVIIYFIF